MRKIMIFFLILILSGCTTENTNVPLLIYDQKDDYMEDFTEKILLSADGVVTIDTYDSQNSQIIQNELIEKLIDDSPLLIINPVDRLSAYNIIKKANQTNTPLIFINREPLNSDLLTGENLYYIGADPIGSAELQAEIVIDLFGGDALDLNERDLNGDNIIQAIILKGQIGHQDAELRTEHVVRYIEEHGFIIEVLEIRVANFDMVTAENEMKLLIEEFGDSMEVVISNNDAMAIGAINTLIEEGYFADLNNNQIIERDSETWFPVIGIDGLDMSIESIDNGYLYGTVINDSESMAKAIVELTYAILNNEDFSTLNYEIIDNIYIWIEYQKYTKID